MADEWITNDLFNLLSDIEWCADGSSYREGFCPCCGGNDPKRDGCGHTRNCELDRLKRICESK